MHVFLLYIGDNICILYYKTFIYIYHQNTHNLVKKRKKRGKTRKHSKKSTKRHSKTKPKTKNTTKTKQKEQSNSSKPKFNKNTIIQIQHLTKQFHKNVILKNIDLEIKKGEIFGLIGMSGSGKTTLLNLIIGFYEPEAGFIYYNNNNKFINIFDDIKLVHKKLGFAPQEPSFYPKLTALENLEHFGSLYSVPKSIILSNVNQLLKLTKLYESKDVLAGELSFGMQKRLGIICALVHKPDILILDEPTADLDPILRSDVLNLILQIKSKGITVIIASHFLDDMEEICDRVGIIKNGKVLKSTTIEEIKQSYSSKKEVLLKTRSKKYGLFMKKLKSNKSLKITKLTTTNTSLKIQSNKPEKVILAVIKLSKRMKQDILELKINNPNLTELFKIIEK